ncbi:NADP-dependent oxidoreductase RED1 [Penicillium sp. IBT 35674x]|nr:NADP-dependent oxidoreductase RED1 [Penicillium sp. IBT 35674x]
MAPNRALIFQQIPDENPIAGKHVTVGMASYDSNVPVPNGGVVVQSLYARFDPYMRSRMRPEEVPSYAPAFKLNEAINSGIIARVIRSQNSLFQEGKLVFGQLPVQEYVALSANELVHIRMLANPLGLDLPVYLSTLGMPGLTAYASFYDIGKPRRSETIFISAACRAAGQVVGQLARREGLHVIGSVGSDEKLDLILNTLHFDGGFNYHKENTHEALFRLAPDGLDIYYDNVGGEILNAALESMKNFGRVVVCGHISQYNSQPFPITTIDNVLYKRLTMRGFLITDPGMGDLYAAEHQERLAKWIRNGSFKVIFDETDGISLSPNGLVDIFHGKNKGKAVLKF